MGSDVVAFTLASDVANAGTFTVSYPNLKNAGSYRIGQDHYAVTNGYGKIGVRNAKASFSFGTSSITITNSSGYTLPAGTSGYVNLDQAGGEGGLPDEGFAAPEKMSEVKLCIIELGAPDAIVTNGIAQAQSATGAHTLTLNGSLVVSGVAILDVPRNVIVDSGGADTAVLTVTGTDEFGAVMVENITLNGTTAVSGKKAFKTVTSITSSATIANAAFVGTGDVLGLPVHLSDLGLVLKEMQDGVAATAGTFVAAVDTIPTATTGDVRGTYDPNSAADAAIQFSFLVALPDPTYKGVAQFDG
jgi:hypothetical protein